MARILRRLKRDFSSARAAWTDVAKDTGLSPSTHRIKRRDTATHFQWEVLGLRKQKTGRRSVRTARVRR